MRAQQRVSIDTAVASDDDSAKRLVKLLLGQHYAYATQLTENTAGKYDLDREKLNWIENELTRSCRQSE